MIYSATAASNLALIKYIGKVATADNGNIENQQAFQNHYKPFAHLSKADKNKLYSHNMSINPSLSYTLNHFITKVQIETSELQKDSMLPFKKDPFCSLKLYTSSKPYVYNKNISALDQSKFLNFFKFLKRCFKISGYYIIRSQNNFPGSSGLASSASSFAALTRATYSILKKSCLNPKQLACISRSGSGSSCRSFFSPWACWEDQNVYAFLNPWTSLSHQVVLLDSKSKKTSSTQAHQLITTSPHFKNRQQRAIQRFDKLKLAFQNKSWQDCFKICYKEFLDLHNLFETSSPSFVYKTKASREVLSLIKKYWEKHKTGPLVTMDAGANIHLLYHKDLKKPKQDLQQILQDYIILSSN